MAQRYHPVPVEIPTLPPAPGGEQELVASPRSPLSPGMRQRSPPPPPRRAIGEAPQSYPSELADATSSPKKRPTRTFKIRAGPPRVVGGVKWPADVQKRRVSPSVFDLDTDELVRLHEEAERLVEFPATARSLDPHGACSRVWQLLMIPAMIFSSLMAPFEIFFELDEACALVWPTLVLDAYFYFDLVVNFHTGYFDHDARRFVTGRWDVARGYLRGWFAVDFLASVPRDMLYAHVEGLYFNHCGLPMQDDDQKTLPFDLSPLDCLRLLRVLRVFRLGRIVSRLDLLGMHYNTGIY